MTKRRRRPLRPFALLAVPAMLALILAACGGDGEGDAPPGLSPVEGAATRATASAPAATAAAEASAATAEAATASPAPAGTATATATATPRPTPTPPAESAESYAGTEPAFPFPDGLTWFNVSEPLTFERLRGKLVLLDFWTQGCINCQHIFPDLERLEEEFGHSLAVIGVHSGKYSEEQTDAAVAEAVARYGLKHAVVNDPEFVVWRQWGARAWPTVVLIDPRGNIVGGRAGEGVYPAFKPVMDGLYAEFWHLGLIDETPLPLALASSVASTFLSFPSEVLADEAGDRLFIADAGHHRIVVTDLDGRVRRSFGTGEPGLADGNPAQARFRDPQGLALSPDGGTLWVADTRNHALRAIDLASGRTTTIAGTGEQVRSLVEGLDATETGLNSPWDIHYHDGSLYIAMAGSHQLWALDLELGYLSVFAGTRRENIDDGHRLREATLAQPSGITGDGEWLYWVDAESSSLRRVPLAGTGDVETIIGTGLFDWGDADGPADSAQIQHAQGLALGEGVIYLADTYNHKVRAYDIAGDAVRTVAGAGERGWLDATGAAATFVEPNALSLANGRLYLADTGNHVIRVIDPAGGAVSTLPLTNLAAAAPPLPDDGVLRVTLPAQHVAPGVGTLRIIVRAPAESHLNSVATSRLELAASNARVAELSETLLTWQTDDPMIAIPVPVELREGEATITGEGVVYYCREGEAALCQIQQLELIAPLRVRADARQGEIVIEYALPATEPTYGGS